MNFSYKPFSIFPSNNIEIINNYNEDLIINQLENEIYQIEQHQKDFAEVYSKYEQLEHDIKILNETNNNLEKDLNLLIEDRKKEINDLKIKNEELIQELNKKIDVNQNLYNENNNIYMLIEEKEKDNSDLKKHIFDQEYEINNINLEKNEILQKSQYLIQKNEQSINDINLLKQEINTYNIKNNEDLNLLKNNDEKNIDILNKLKEEQNIYNNLVIELNNKTRELNDIKNKLYDTELILSNLKNDIKFQNENCEKNQNEIILLNDEIIKEVSFSNDLNEKNKNMIELINDGDKKSNIYIGENEQYKKDIEEFKKVINDLNIKLHGYKQHFIVLNDQNNTLSKELEFIVERDKQISEDFQLLEHLKEVANNNNELIKKCIDNKNYG